MKGSDMLEKLIPKVFPNIRILFKNNSGEAPSRIKIR